MTATFTLFIAFGFGFDINAYAHSTEFALNSIYQTEFKSCSIAKKFKVNIQKWDFSVDDGTFWVKLPNDSEKHRFWQHLPKNYSFLADETTYRVTHYQVGGRGGPHCLHFISAPMNEIPKKNNNKRKP